MAGADRPADAHSATRMKPGRLLATAAAGGAATAPTLVLLRRRLASPRYDRVPRSYVILQRINLGLFAVLGELSATADWRAIAEEIWPFARGPASTPMGEEPRPHGGAAPGRSRPDWQ